jgi:hypothetical protein
MAGTDVRAPDGREWKVRSYRFRWPPVLGISAHGESFSAGAMLFRLLFGLVVGLIIFLIASLVKALVTPFLRSAWVEASSSKPDRKLLTWKTSRASSAAVTTEVVQQLTAGQDPQPQNAQLASR